jgi:penicillin-binding protein 2
MSINREQSSVPAYRVYLLGMVFGAAILIYLGYLFSLQIIDGYVYTMRAEQVTRRSVVQPAQRGEIYDRNYDVPLATNVDSFAVTVNPANVSRDDLPEVLQQLSELLSIPRTDLEEALAGAGRTFRNIEVAAGVPYDQIVRVAERKTALPGVDWHIKPRRTYPFEDSVAHVIGYVGDITRQELQVLFNQGYTASNVVGKSGIELELDGLLRGKDGIRYRMVDAQGRRVGDSKAADVAPEQGKNVVLTIDRHVQDLAKKALGERIGSVVVLRPATGEILAMASYPTFNPNQFHTDSTYFSRVSLDSNSPFLNRAIHTSTAPASTFKVLMTTAVVEEEAFPLDSVVDCVGYRRYGNRVFKCHKEYGHGELNIFGGLAESCNVFFYTMGTDHLGVETIVDYCEQFGFGEPTGIDLPGEDPGLVPSPAWKEANWNTPWVGGDTVNLSIGQGFIEVTPLQLANMVAMIVNDGVLYRPHVVKEIRDPVTGEILKRSTPEVLRASDISVSTFQTVRTAMRGVITDGTAKVVVTTDATTVAGKTGTGQTAVEDAKHSWFVAFAPYDTNDPAEQVIVSVFVDAANEWDWWAPKAANIILHGMFTSQNYEQTVEDLWPLWYLDPPQSETVNSTVRFRTEADAGGVDG